MKDSPAARWLAFLLVIPLFARSEQPTVPAKPAGTAGTIHGITRYEGPIELSTKSGARPFGALAEGSIALKRDWGIRGRQRIELFPITGLTIVYLNAGLVTTSIDGQQVKRTTGEYWVVPAGSRMSITVTSESASLQTFSIK
jgi:hypothetical protein